MTKLYQLYKRRFLIGAIVGFANLTNQVVWASYASIAVTSASYYETTSLGITMLSLIYMIVFIITSPVASWILGEKGIRYSIIIGTCTNFVGAMVKWTSVYAEGGTTKYAICFLGQTIAGIGQPFLCNCNLLSFNNKCLLKWLLNGFLLMNVLWLMLL